MGTWSSAARILDQVDSPGKKHQIGDDEPVGSLFPQQQGFDAVGGSVHGIACDFQAGLEEVAHADFVVHDQHASLSHAIHRSLPRWMVIEMSREL